MLELMFLVTSLGFNLKVFESTGSLTNLMFIKSHALSTAAWAVTPQISSG